MISFLAGFSIACILISALFCMFRFDFRTMSNRVDDIDDRVCSLEDSSVKRSIFDCDE